MYVEAGPESPTDIPAWPGTGPSSTSTKDQGFWMESNTYRGPGRRWCLPPVSQVFSNQEPKPALSAGATLCSNRISRCVRLPGTRHTRLSRETQYATAHHDLPRKDLGYLAENCARRPRGGAGLRHFAAISIARAGTICDQLSRPPSDSRYCHRRRARAAFRF